MILWMEFKEVLGMNTALRISDILGLKWDDVYNAEEKCYKEHVSLLERKTEKRNTIMLNSAATQALTMYMNTLTDAPQGFLFESNKGHNRPISRQQAFRIVKEAAAYAGFKEGISCHSLRKTFGYYAIIIILRIP